MLALRVLSAGMAAIMLILIMGYRMEERSLKQAAAVEDQQLIVCTYERAHSITLDPILLCTWYLIHEAQSILYSSASDVLMPS